MHPFLRHQQLAYTIFVIDQRQPKLFNRGALLNIGFLEASKRHPYSCFIFHDVDLLPEDDRNLYTCEAQPLHLSVAIDKFAYKYKRLAEAKKLWKNDTFQSVKYRVLQHSLRHAGLYYYLQVDLLLS
nr:unnamed protein product [Spirometra erinaceieuropaei]